MIQNLFNVNKKTPEQRLQTFFIVEFEQVFTHRDRSKDLSKKKIHISFIFK